MKFVIRYWRNPSGKAPVEGYIDDVDNKEERQKYSPRSMVYSIMRRMLSGLTLDREGKLWELKMRIYGSQHRIFYVVLRGNEMILLHAYLKKTPRAPVREIEIAKQRMKQLKEDRK